MMKKMNSSCVEYRCCFCSLVGQPGVFDWVQQLSLSAHCGAAPRVKAEVNHQLYLFFVSSMDGLLS